MLKRFTRKPGPFSLTSPPPQDVSHARTTTGPLSDPRSPMTLDDSKLSTLRTEEPRALPESPASQSSFEDLLSFSSSSSNAGKELPALPSPTISTISSIPESVIPYSSFTRYGRPQPSVVIPGSLARPDSATLPLTAANLGLFFPSGTIDDFYHPQYQEGELTRYSAARDRVRRWVESGSHTISSLGNPWHPDSFASDDAGPEGLPTDYPVIMGLYDGDDFTANNVQQQYVSPRHPLHPDLHFNASTPIEARPSSIGPERLSFPISVGYSDALGHPHDPSALYPSRAAPSRPIPHDVLSQISERDPSLAESISKAPTQALPSIPSFERSQESASSFFPSKPIDTAVSPASNPGSSKRHKNPSPVATSVSAVTKDESDGYSISRPITRSSTRDGMARRPETLLWPSGPPSGAITPPEQSFASKIEQSPHEGEPGLQSVDHSDAGDQRDTNNNLSEDKILEAGHPQIHSLDSSLASTHGRSKLVLSVASISVKSMRSVNYDDPVIPSSVDGSVMSHAPSPLPCEVDSEDSDSIVAQHGDQTPVASPSMPRGLELVDEVKPQFDRTEDELVPSTREAPAFEPTASEDDNILVVPPSPTTTIGSDDSPELQPQSTPPDQWTPSLLPDRELLRTRSMSTISERTSEAVVSFRERNEIVEEDVESVESKPLPSLPAESPRGSSLVTLRSVSPLEEVRIQTMENVQTTSEPFQENGTQGSPESSESVSTIRAPHMVQGPSRLVQESVRPLEEGPAEDRSIEAKILYHDSASASGLVDESAIEQASSKTPRQVSAPPLAEDSLQPSVDVAQLVSEIHELGGRCADGILELIKFISTCHVLADRHTILKLCVSVRDAVETVIMTLDAGPKRSEDIQGAPSSWMVAFADRLLSLKNNLTKMIDFVVGMRRRPPRIDRVENAMDKLKAWSAKFLNISLKLDSSYEKLEAHRAYSDLLAKYRSTKALRAQSRRERERFVKSPLSPWNGEKRGLAGSEGVSS